MSCLKKRNGFTLIELLVVITIITILSVVGFVSFQNVRDQANKARMRADVDAIRKAYEQNFDPSLNGGQGGYKPLTAANFASGKIPVPRPAESPGSNNTYIIVGPDVSGSLNNSNTSFLACVQPDGANKCTASSATCYCGSSSGGSGTPVAVFSGDQTNPGTSCKDILAKNGTSATDGIYHIKPKPTSSPYPVYCDMKTDGGGWTLLMKSDGNTSTFKYESSYWTDNTTINEDMTGFNISNNGDAKYQAYNDLPITEIRATWPKLTHNPMIESIESVNPPKTALNVFSTGRIIVDGGSSLNPTGNPTGAYAKLVGFGLHDDLPFQGYGAYGFNLKAQDFPDTNPAPSPSPTVYGGRVRWGWLWNNEGNFLNNDASAGIGLDYTQSVSAGGWVNYKNPGEPMDKGAYPKQFRLWGR